MLRFVEESDQQWLALKRPTPCHHRLSCPEGSATH